MSTVFNNSTRKWNMSWNRKRIQLGVVLMLGLACLGLVAADDTKKAPAENSSGLVAPEFAEHLDVDAASAALRDEDEETLLEIGEKLGAAERTLQKQNPVLPAIKFFEMAISVAQHKHDLKVLDGLVIKIKATKVLSDRDKATLLAKIEETKKLVASPRKIDAGPGLKASEVSAESVALYKTFLEEIRNTQEYGTEEELMILVDAIKQLREFHPKQREHLLKRIVDVRVAIKERDEVDPAAMKLVASSRFFPSEPGIRVVGPSTVPASGKFTLVVIPFPPKGLKTGTLFGSTTNRAVTVAAKTPWSGKATLVPVTVNGQPGMSIGVKLGLEEGGPLLTWTGRTILATRQ